MNPNEHTLIAIDISKEVLEVKTPKGRHRVANSQQDLERFVQSLKQMKSPWVICEATGGYERGLMRELFRQEVTVSLINPQLTYAFARSEGVRAKSDPIDADMLMRFAIQKTLRPTVPLEHVLEQTQGLLDRRTQLINMLKAEKNRMEKNPLYATQSFRETIEFLEKQIAGIDKELADLDAVNESFRLKRERLTRIKGVGNLTAWTVLAYLPEIEELNRNCLVSLAGLAPFNADSGLTQGKRHIIGGRAKVRRCLYMATQSASLYNPVIKAYKDRLLARGKPSKVATVAAMRKLLLCMQSMLKNPNFSLA